MGFYAFRETEIVTSVHAHPAGEIIIANEGTFSLETEAGTWSGLTAALIPPNLTHALTATAGEFLLYMYEQPSALDRLSQSGRLCGGFYVLTEPVSAIWQIDALRTAHAERDLNQIPDERVGRCLQLIKARSSDPDLSTSDLAAEVFLSPGRLGHLFRVEMGLSVSKYILWARTRDAVHHFLAGEVNLQTVALGAGFYDPAHFSRTFRAFFGEKPSFAYNSHTVQDRSDQPDDLCGLNY